MEVVRVRDPVCGMEVDPKRAAEKIDYEGRTYYFCSETCAQRFRENPEEYASKQAVTGQAPGLDGESQVQATPEQVHVRHQAESGSALRLAELHLEVERSIGVLPSVTTGIPEGARRVRVELPIEGLDCPVCAQNIGRALLALPGVERAAVNPSTRVATVAYDRTKVGLPEMSRAVRDAGYQVGLATARIGIEGIF